MWLRRLFFRWLIPAAFVLPLWIVVGWAVFNASGWAFLWVLLIAVPSVLVAQLVVSLFVRARGTVRAERAVSWWDVLVFTLWHGLTIAVGFFPQGAFWPLLFGATAAFLAVFWVSLWQLFQEARPSVVFARAGGARSFLRDAASGTRASEPEVLVVKEAHRAER